MEGKEGHQIVVADGLTTWPCSDARWDALAPANLRYVYDEGPHSANLVAVIKERRSTVLGVNKYEVKDEHFVAQLADAGVDLIAILAKGYDVVDLSLCRKYGISVMCAATYNGFAVAQHTMAMLLARTNLVAQYNAQIKMGNWTTGFSWMPADLQHISLDGMTAGIIGWGLAGQKVGACLETLGATVLAYDTVWPDSPSPNQKCNSWEQIFEQCNFVSLHCPLNQHTSGRVNLDLLRRMPADKPRILANTARGAIVMQEDALDALDQGFLDFYLADVWPDEPPVDTRLINHKKVVATSHVAWVNGKFRMVTETRQNVANYYAGNATRPYLVN